MFGQPGGGRRLQELVATFRAKSAVTPEKAMTIEELGLPPRFETAMHRRLGATGIFVEVSGRYYLDEVRLAQFQQRRAGALGNPGAGSGWRSRQDMVTLRMARVAIAITAVLLIIANIVFIRSIYVSAVVLVLIIAWVVLTAFQFYYLARMRNRRSGTGQTDGASSQ